MTAAKDPTSRVLAEIADGRHDGNLWQMSEAIAARLNTDATGLLWRITLNGDVWDAETVTMGEIRRAEAGTGKGYLDLAPATSMRDFAALVVAHYMTQGMTYEQAVDKADSISQSQAVDAITMYEGTLGKGSASTES